MYNFEGWGNLVYFDTVEHHINRHRVLLTTIPKLAAEWKIIYDFKPTECWVDAADVLVVSLTSDHGEFEFMISSLREEIYLGLWDSTNEVLVQQFKSNQLLKLHDPFDSIFYLKLKILLQSLIISREGLILTLSILPCPLGKIF